MQVGWFDVPARVLTRGRRSVRNGWGTRVAFYPATLSPHPCPAVAAGRAEIVGALAGSQPVFLSQRPAARRRVREYVGCGPLVATSFDPGGPLSDPCQNQRIVDIGSASTPIRRPHPPTDFSAESEIDKKMGRPDDGSAPSLGRRAGLGAPAGASVNPLFVWDEGENLLIFFQARMARAVFPARERVL